MSEQEGDEEGSSGAPQEPGSDPFIDKKALQNKWLNALKRGNLQEFEDLMENEALDLTYNYRTEGTCLEIACRLRNRSRFVRALLKKVSPSVNRIVPEPIHYAVREGADDTLSELLNHKNIDVNAVTSKGETPLHFLANYYKPNSKYRRCLNLLLKHPDIDINKHNHAGFTPIHQAASRKHREMVEQILKIHRDNLDLDTYCGNGLTAREFLKLRYGDLAPLFPPDRVKLSAAYRDQLLDAFNSRQTELFKLLLQQVDEDGYAVFDANYRYGKPHNETCLEMACRKKGCEEFIKILLAAGADPNLVNPNSKMAAIQVAAEALNYEALKILLDPKIKTNASATNSKGWTALHYAAASQALQVLDTSPESAEADQVLSDFRKCLQILNEHISISVDVESVTKLINFTTNPKETEKVRKIVEDILRVERSQTIDLCDQLCEYLRNRQADRFIDKFEDRIKENDTSLSRHQSNFLRLAIENNLVTVVSVLLGNKTDPNESSEGHLPLIMATDLIDTNILDLLLKVPDIDVNITDKKGDTALHHAVRKDNHAGIITLLNHGADIGIENVLGKAPFSLSSLKTRLDKSLRSKEDSYPKNEDYEVIFDYTFLTASKMVFEESADDRTTTVEDGAATEEDKRGKVEIGDGSKQVVVNVDEHELVPLVKTESQTSSISNSVSNTTANTPQNEQVPKEKGTKLVPVGLKAETEILRYISNHHKEYKEILDHPVISSFLKLKWKCVRHFFYINIVFYVVFFFILNLYIMFSSGPPSSSNLDHSSAIKCFFIDRLDSELLWNSTLSDMKCYQMANESSTLENITHCSEVMKFCSGVRMSQNSSSAAANYDCLDSPWCFFLIVTLAVCSAILALREGLQILTRGLSYWENLENYLDIAIIVMSFVVMLLPSDNEYLESCHVFLILLSSCELILLLGREPKFSQNIEMLKTVTISYIGLFFTFLTIILAFSHCLYIVFRPDMHKDGIYTALWTICRTMVFMTGEYEADDLHFSSMPFTSIIVFLLFVFFISIVLLNLLIGLSVNNTKMITETSEVVCITSRIDLIYEIEVTMLNFYKAFKCCNCCYHWTESVILFPKPAEEKVIRALRNADGKLKSNPINNSCLRRRIYSLISGIKKCFRNCSSIMYKRNRTHRQQKATPQIDKCILENAVKIISSRSQSKIKTDEEKKIELKRKVLDILDDLE